MKTLLPTCRITIKTGTGILVNSAGLVTVTHTTKPLGAAGAAVEIDIWLSGNKTRYALPYNRAKQVSATRIDASATLMISGVTLADCFGFLASDIGRDFCYTIYRNPYTAKL